MQSKKPYTTHQINAAQRNCPFKLSIHTVLKVWNCPSGDLTTTNKLHIYWENVYVEFLSFSSRFLISYFCSFIS